MAKPRVKYEVYERWYDHYARRGQMKYGKMSRDAFMATWRDARAAGLNMRDFSRTIAMRQRSASESQLIATWGATKKQLTEFRKAIRSKRKDFIGESLRDYVTGGKKLSEAEIERQIRRIRKKGIPEFIRDDAEKRLRQYYLDQKDEIIESLPDDKKEDLSEVLTMYQFVEEYRDITWDEFRMNQTSIVKTARVLTEDRYLWDEAFKLAFHSPKEK